MLRRTFVNLFLVFAVLLTLGVSAVSGAPPAQEELTYTVKLGDNLWTLAEKYLGNGPAYWAIVDATNAKYAEDSSFANIEDPNLIHPGWKLLISGAEAPAEGVSGGHLMVGFDTTMQEGGDLHLTTSSHDRFMAAQVAEPLLRKNPEDGNYYPGLAESWEVADDNLSVTLHLRKDVTFHDGTPFNAEAVEFSLNRIATYEEAEGRDAYSLLGVGDFFDRVEVIDDYTVQLFYKKVYARMIESLAAMEVAMYPPAACEEAGEGWGTTTLIGTGPFKWVEWTGASGEFTVERYEEYNWAPSYMKHQGPAYLDGFTIKGIEEASTRSAAVESGAVHLTTIQASDLEYFEGLPGFKTEINPKQGTARVLSLNLLKPILQDVRVRQAIAHAIDREAVVASPHFSGVGAVAINYLTAVTWGGDVEQFREYNYMYDVEKAKALLEEVGWKDEDGDGVREAHGVEGVEDGTKLHFVDLCLSDAQPECELNQGFLAAVGIETELEIHDFGTWLDKRIDGDFDIGGDSMSGSNLFLLYSWFGTGAPINDVRYSNTEVDALFDAAFADPDPEAQREYFAEAQKLVLQDVPLVPIIDIMYVWAMDEAVEDMGVDYAGIGVHLYDTWINPNP